MTHPAGRALSTKTSSPGQALETNYRTSFALRYRRAVSKSSAPSVLRYLSTDGVRYLTTNGCSQRQRGVALVVALILLIVITLVGLAAVSGTIMQNKMASNLYDREVAFQSSEAGLRAAQESVTANPEASYIRDCSIASGHLCL